MPGGAELGGGHYFTPHPPTPSIAPIKLPVVGVVERFLLKGSLKVPVIAELWKSQFTSKGRTHEVDLIVVQTQETLKCLMLVTYFVANEITCVLERLVGTANGLSITLDGKDMRYLRRGNEKDDYRLDHIQLTLSENNAEMSGTISDGTSCDLLTLRSAKLS